MVKIVNKWRKPKNTGNKVGEAKGGFKLPLGEILSFVKNIFASAQNYIGIDLGSSTIKIAQLQKGSQGLYHHQLHHPRPAPRPKR